MKNLDAVIDIKPKDFVLTSHLLDESLPRKGILRDVPKDEMESAISKSFSRTGLYVFSSLPSLIKNKWVFEERPERYFRFDRETAILYVCSKENCGRERVISGYDLNSRKKKFELNEIL